MSKHQEILEYLEKLAIGKRVSVRSISNHMKVSDGTAYRAIKEAENRGIVETKPRSGTVRVERKNRMRIDKLTYTEIARISNSEVLAGHVGLSHEFSKFSIGAMTEKNIGRYLVKGGLLIVGDREEIQLLALKNHNAILVTGGFPISNRVLSTANQLGIPVMVTRYDTFTVATLINHALLNFRIKTDLKTVENALIPLDDYGYIHELDSIANFNRLAKATSHVRFPVLNKENKIVGVVSMRDIVGREPDTIIREIMSQDPIVVYPKTSLANVGQKMIFEDLNMLPVVDDDDRVMGVITRRHAMDNLKKSPAISHNTYSEQIISELEEYNHFFQLVVEPNMIDSTGNLAQGIISEILKEITVKVLTRKYQKNIIIEQMMIYFLHAAQIEDHLKIYPKIITETRRSGIVDFEIYINNQIVAKAVITSRIN